MVTAFSGEVSTGRAQEIRRLAVDEHHAGAALLGAAAEAAAAQPQLLPQHREQRSRTVAIDVN